MVECQSFKVEFGKLCALAFPILLSGAVNAVMPFMNTVFLGRLGGNALAIGGLCLSIFVFIMVLFWGMFATLSPLIARLHSAGEDASVAPMLRAGLFLTLPASALIIGIYHYVDKVLLLFNYAPSIVAEVKRFFLVLSFATPADLMLTTLYAFCFGISKPKYVLAVTLVQIPVNLLLNHAFMYGDFGFKSFGIAGIGMGMACTYWLVLLGLGFLLLSLPIPRAYLHSKQKFHWNKVKEILTVGGPSGLQWLFTMGFFAMIALLMGRLSLVALAAYQVVFQIYSLIYNIVYNFNQAVTIRIADGLGRGSKREVLYNYWGAYVFIGVVSSLVVVTIVFLHQPLIRLFVKEGVAAAPGFDAYARLFLFLLPVFMIVDLLNYTHFEVLRAFKDTRFSMWLTLFVYWVLTVPGLLSMIHQGLLTKPSLLWLVMVFSSALCLVGQVGRYYFNICRIK